MDIGLAIKRGSDVPTSTQLYRARNRWVLVLPSLDRNIHELGSGLLPLLRHHLLLICSIQPVWEMVQLQRGG